MNMWLYYGVIAINMVGVVMNEVLRRRMKASQKEFEDACKVLFDLERQANMMLREMEQD